MGDMLIRDIPEDLKQDIEHAAKKAGRSLSATAIDLLQKSVTPANKEPARRTGNTWNELRAIIAPDGQFDDEHARFMDKIEAERKRDFGRPIEWPE